MISMYEVAGFLFESEEEYDKWDEWTDGHTKVRQRNRFNIKYGDETWEGLTLWHVAINHHYCQLDKKLQVRRKRESERRRRREIETIAEWLER